MIEAIDQIQTVALFALAAWNLIHTMSNKQTFDKQLDLNDKFIKFNTTIIDGQNKADKRILRLELKR